MDDILVSPPTEEAHLAVLDQVMVRLEKHGLRRKLAKCSFLENSEHVGHRIDEHGLHPMEDKVEAIRNAPAPQNVSELIIMDVFGQPFNITASFALAFASRHQMESVTML